MICRNNKSCIYYTNTPIAKNHELEKVVKNNASPEENINKLIEGGAEVTFEALGNAIKFNINGVYNSRKADVIFREEVTINAKSKAMLILDIMDKYKGAKKIHLILDNASYNRAKIMQLLANHSRIDLIYLRTYCPNLNLIERIWKFLHIDALLFLGITKSLLILRRLQ